jgi:hypothetical protein
MPLVVTNIYNDPVDNIYEFRILNEFKFTACPNANILNRLRYTYSVEITYGINSVISKLMTFVENAETGQFLFLIMLILSYFTCS